MSGTGYVPLPTPVTANPQFWNQGLEGLNALRDYQAKQATADAYRQSINPDGTLNQAKFNALVVSGPGAWNAGPAMQQQGQAQGAQAVGSADQVAGRLAQLKVMSGEMTDLLQSGQPVTADQVRTRLNSLGQQGIITPAAMQGVLADLNSQPPGADLSGWVRNHMATNQSATEQLQNVTSQPYHVNMGGTDMVFEGNPRLRGYRAPGTSTPITPTPGEALQGGYHYSATQADVDAGRATAVGQDVYIPGAEVYRRAGLPVPPGLQGGGRGPGVVDSSGKPVGPNNPPRLLNVPGQTNAATPPAPPGTATPAPTGGPPAPAAPGGNVGFGAAIGGAQGAPAPAMPVPPVPPPNAPVTAPASVPAPGAPATAPVWNPNNPVGTSTLTPSTTNPAIAAAQTRAKATGQPVPIPGMQGTVANPNGTIGPPPGGGFGGRPALVVPPAPTPPANGRIAALQGGVPVASANPLQVPATGAAGPPSPLVPGDVNAIMVGMNQARAAPAQGTQVAFNTIATGPGTEAAQGYKTSADKLASDDLAAANFQSTQFPYVQALKNYGEGTKTGPSTDFWNQVAGSIRTPLAKIGINVGPLSDTTERVDALGKWLASIQSANPVSSRSDAELAQVLKGSASTHINEVAGEDMVKAGLALQRMNVAANREWHSNPAMQQQYGTYLNFLGNYNNTVDPRAFMLDTLNPAQIQRLRLQLQSGSEADAQRFENTLALARRNGLIGGGGSQAMP